MKTTKKTPKVAPTAEQAAAIHRFAGLDIARWRAALDLAWSTGVYPRDTSSDDRALLQQVRNTRNGWNTTDPMPEMPAEMLTEINNPVGDGTINITVDVPSLRILIHSAMASAARLTDAAEKCEPGAARDTLNDAAARSERAARSVMKAAGLGFAEDNETLERR